MSWPAIAKRNRKLVQKSSAISPKIFAVLCLADLDFERLVFLSCRQADGDPHISCIFWSSTPSYTVNTEKLFAVGRRVCAMQLEPGLDGTWSRGREYERVRPL